MAFANGDHVKRTVEEMIVAVIERVVKNHRLVQPALSPYLEATDQEKPGKSTSNWVYKGGPVPRMSYETAMAKHGTDKPDLRINTEDASEVRVAGQRAVR